MAYSRNASLGSTLYAVSHKTTPEQVRTIVRMKVSVELVSVIARIVNVDPTTVYRVLQRVEDGDIRVA